MTLVKIVAVSAIAAAAAGLTESLLGEALGRTLALTAAVIVGGGTYLAIGAVVRIEVVIAVMRKFVHRRTTS